MIQYCDHQLQEMVNSLRAKFLFVTCGWVNDEGCASVCRSIKTKQTHCIKIDFGTVSFVNPVIPKFFPGPSSAQALGISPAYHFPISICRTSSLLPALIGAFQAIQLVAPILLNEPATSRPATTKLLLIKPIEYWQIWMDIAWVREPRRQLLNLCSAPFAAICRLDLQMA